MSKKERITFLPRLRFPEFSSTGGWDRFTLEKVADRITEKVGDKQLVTLSISAGTGFVSQAEKFSRDISGKQYHNYIYLRKGDFSYNKGNSKTFPQGCIYELLEHDEAAVPNAFISFHFKEAYVPNFYKGYFENNFHGKQLKKFITSGARMDGLLNIKPLDFFSIVLPTPKDKNEQQKIADCLSSLDELIATEDKKLTALRKHKNGLMQKLFPAEGKTVPEWRFLEFRDSGEWSKCSLKEMFSIMQGYAFQSGHSTSKGVRWLKIADVSVQYMNHSSPSYLPVEYKNIYETFTVKQGDYVIALTRPILSGMLKIAKVDIVFDGALLNQRVGKLVTAQNSSFVYYLLQTSKIINNIEKSISGSEPPNLSTKQIEFIRSFIPSKTEQKKISDCLSAVDVLITAQLEKIEALKKHKKGLMQGLFPSIEVVEQ